MAANRVAKWHGSAWSALSTGLNSDVSALAVDGSGNVYVGGGFNTVGDGSKVTAFFGIYGSSSALATTAALAGAQATLYPNPAEGPATTLALTGLPGTVHTVQATVYDALGRPVGQLTLSPSQGAATASLPVRTLTSGVYELRLNARDAQGAAVGSLPALRLSVR